MSPAPPTAQATEPSDKPSPGAKIVGVLFFLCFFAAIVGFFIYAAGDNLGAGVLLKRVDTYAVTSQRLIVFSSKRNPVKSVLLSSAYDIRMQEWPDGLGTITFGPEATWPYSTQITRNNASLENIAEPRKVFQIIAQARKTA